ncbi:hypothetical protein AB0C96_34710 [Streptomyces sp. NPDC048506]
MAVAFRLSASALEPGRHGSNGRMAAHSAAVMSDGFRRTRSG